MPPYDSPASAIARATGEDPRDVLAALGALMADGHTFDEVWEMMRDAINDGTGIVDMAASVLRPK